MGDPDSSLKITIGPTELQVLGITAEFNEGKYEATITYPGLMYDDYDLNTRQPKLWKLLTIFDACITYRDYVSLDKSSRTFMDWVKVRENYLVFIASSELILTRDMYREHVAKIPLLVKSTAGFIGKSSRNSKYIMTNKDNKILATAEMQIVMIDPVTRKSAPLPHWWKNKYAEVGAHHRPLKLPLVDRPVETVSYTTNVRFSDTDFNNHASWTFYVKASMNAAQHCFRKGQLNAFGDRITRGVERVQMLFAGESYEGDALTVHVWEPIEDKNRLMFHITKDAELLWQISFDFFKHEYPSML